MFASGRALRRVLLIMAVGCGSALACDNRDPDYEASAPRLIDYECQTGAYSLQGDADLTTGLSDDSCAFVLGPGGSVSFSLPQSNNVEALIAVGDAESARWTAAYSPTPGTIANTGDVKLRVLDLRVRSYIGNCD